MALVTGATNTGVSWSFTPTVAGATIGPPAGPDARRHLDELVHSSLTRQHDHHSHRDRDQLAGSVPIRHATITLRPVLDVGTGAPAALVNQF